MGSLVVQPPSGVVRNITEVFIFLRGNAHQQRLSNKAFEPDNDRTALIVIDEDEGTTAFTKSPPSWVAVLDEILYEITRRDFCAEPLLTISTLRIKSRKALLKELQQKHVVRPDFSDDVSLSEQQKIQEMTDELTSMFAHCKRLVRLIEEAPPDTGANLRLRENATAAQLLILNGLFQEFRTTQSQYVMQLDSRKHNVNSFVLSSHVPTTSDIIPSSADEGELTIDMIQQILDNESLVREREEEVINISKSIVELNTLFKDVASLVLDQGSILDRIDYNVEQTTFRIKSSTKSLQKAERYQNNRRMRYIVYLAGIALFLMFLLVLKKL